MPPAVEEEKNEKILNLENQVQELNEKVTSITDDLAHQRKDSEEAYAGLKTQYESEQGENKKLQQDMVQLQENIKNEQELRAKEVHGLQSTISVIIDEKAELEQSFKKKQSDLQNAINESMVDNVAAQKQIEGLQQELAQSKCNLTAAKKQNDAEHLQQTELINQKTE